MVSTLIFSNCILLSDFANFKSESVRLSYPNNINYTIESPTDGTVHYILVVVVVLVPARSEVEIAKNWIVRLRLSIPLIPPKREDVARNSDVSSASLDAIFGIDLPFSALFSVAQCCSPDVKFEKDHHRRKELEDKFIHNLADLKNHEEILLKAVEAMKMANAKKDDDEMDYKKRIEEIEKELKATKEDHTRLLEKHENYMRAFERPRTWSETISKYTGDAFGRLLFNGVWGALVLLLPLLIRPFQRRWLTALRGGDGPTIEEVTESDEDGVRISNDEVKRILNDGKGRKKALKAE